MPQPETQGNDSVNNTMKSMNTMMPLMSAFFCFTLPVGVGIYWIAGALIRTVQMLVINKHMSKIDVNELIEKNLDKMNKKREKQGLPPQKITNQARVNVRNLDVDQEAKRQQDNAKRVQDSTAYYNSANAKPGSIASKANMVKQYEEKNSKKK